MLRKTYDWTMRLAAHPHALAWLALRRRDVYKDPDLDAATRACEELRLIDEPREVGAADEHVALVGLAAGITVTIPDRNDGDAHVV